MNEPVGYVYSWSDQYIYVLITSDIYKPSIGDIMYVKTSDRYVLLQVIGYEGEVPVPPSSIVKEPYSKPPLYSIAKTMYAKTILFFEIRMIKTETGEYPVVTKPTQPPSLDSIVYLITRGDPESEKIMNYLSQGVKAVKELSEPVPVAWLRSGVASLDILRREKYFENAKLLVDLKTIVPKHILVTGQTGSGKTTSIMGIVTQWCLRSEPNISWLIIDRHGEYSIWRNNSFLDLLSKAVSLNRNMDSLEINVYVLESSGENFEKPNQFINRLTGSIDLTNIDISDLASILELPIEQISELEELVNLVTNLFEVVKDSNLLPIEWVNVFIKDSEGTGNLLALIPLLVDNVIRYEGIGEREKKGLYETILRTIGINIHRLRMYRRILLSNLSLRIERKNLKTQTGYETISVIDDSNSVFKTTILVKNPWFLVKVLTALLSALDKIRGTLSNKIRGTSSPVLSKLKILDSLKQDENILQKLYGGSINLDNVVNKLNSDRSSIVILDVSKIPSVQADIVVMSVLRRVFEQRVYMGVDKSSMLPKLAVVSEEAPLYLNPEKVSSPYNVFARIAREGRKFGIGLIAITQIATDIEKQILANFNTLIVLRTKHSSDLNYFKNIGIPSETLTSLGDREGYLYTSDLSVKEPIPVYIPGYFDYIDYITEEYSKSVREKESFEETGRKVFSIISRREGVKQ
ncbi:MAG: DUF87 domain-containing protein [Desulfurococcaceae archaeon]